MIPINIRAVEKIINFGLPNIFLSVVIMKTKSAGRELTTLTLTIEWI